MTNEDTLMITADLTPEKLNDWFSKRNVNLERLAVENNLFWRLRSRMSPAAMLMLCLMWGAGVYTLRELAAFARVRNLCKISDVALLKRMRKARRFVEAAVQAVLTANINNAVVPPKGKSLQLVCVDGTRGRDRLKHKAGEGFILHYGFRLEISDTISCQTEFFEFTADKGKGTGESLARATCHYRPGDIVLADRGYCTAKGIAAVLLAKANFIVRACMSTVALACSADGKDRIALAQAIREMQLKEEEMGETKLWMRENPENWRCIRICVQRRSQEDAEIARKAYWKQTGKSQGRRGNPSISENAIFLCDYIVLITSLSEAEFSLDEILKLYKIRWQVELVFKRFKSIGDLEVLPTSNTQSTEVFRMSKMLAFLLTEEEFGNQEAEIAKLENTGIDEDGTNPKMAKPQDDFFWRKFRLGFQCVLSRLNQIQRFSYKEKDRLMQFLYVFDHRERGRKRKRAVSNIGWKIFSKRCA